MAVTHDPNELVHQQHNSIKVERSKIITYINIVLFCSETDKSYHFFEANQQRPASNPFHELSMTSVSIDVIGAFWQAVKRELYGIV